MRITTGYCATKTSVAEIETLRWQPDLNTSRLYLHTFIFESNYICFRVISKTFRIEKIIQLDALKTSIVFKIPAAFGYVNVIMLLNIVSPQVLY